MNEQRDPLTYRVIGEAMATHSALGAGLDEEFYHRELSARLAAAGIAHLSKPKKDLVYRGIVADTFEADLVLEDRLVIELKVLRGEFVNEHLAQAFTYMKFWRIGKGLLLDFGKASLKQKRLVYTSREAVLVSPDVPEFVGNPELAERLIQVSSRCLADIRLGYRETTWMGLIAAALKSEGIEFVVNPSADIGSHRSAGFRCFAIEQECAISVSALGTEVTASDRARLQTCLRWLDLPFGIAFHFGTERAEARFVSNPKSSVPQIRDGRREC